MRFLYYILLITKITSVIKLRLKERTVYGISADLMSCAYLKYTKVSSDIPTVCILLNLMPVILVRGHILCVVLLYLTLLVV